MADLSGGKEPLVSFETHPSRYIHWKLRIEAPVARLLMDVQEDKPMREGYVLKTNSYDLGVDIELWDAVERLRFEHPEVRCLIIGSAKDRIFCSGANIYMLGSSTHAFKVNFCKFTNETRLYLEDASANSGLRSIAVGSGAWAGGGPEPPLAGPSKPPTGRGGTGACRRRAGRALERSSPTRSWAAWSAATSSP